MPTRSPTAKRSASVTLLDDPADDLVARHGAGRCGGEVALGEVEIRAADAAGRHSNEHLARPGRWIGRSPDPERPGVDRARMLDPPRRARRRSSHRRDDAVMTTPAVTADGCRGRPDRGRGTGPRRRRSRPTRSSTRRAARCRRSCAPTSSTRFNALLGSLLVVILIVGPPQDALFGIILVVNTLVGIVQEVRAKRTLDRLVVVGGATATVVRAEGEPRGAVS